MGGDAGDRAVVWERLERGWQRVEGGWERVKEGSEWVVGEWEECAGGRTQVRAAGEGLGMLRKG